MRPLDPVVLSLAILFMAAVATMAAFVPAYRATGVDLREVLQGD